MPSSAFPQYSNVKANLPETVLIVGRVLLDPTTPTVLAGRGFTVTKGGTGLYRINFLKRVGRILAAPAMYHLAASADQHLDGTIIADANQYVEFRTKTAAGVATDFAAGAEISFVAAVMMARLPVK